MNMLKRITTGAVLVAVTLAFFALRGINYRWFYVYFAFISLVSTYEMVRLVGERLNLFQKIAVMGGQALALAAFFLGEEFPFSQGYSGFVLAFASYIAAVMVILTVSIFSKKEEPLDGLAYSTLCLFYPGVLHLSMFALNALESNSLVALTLLFAVSPLADTFAFFTGMLFKGEKLCPSISPKKTISGAIGGLLSGTGGGILVYAVLNAQNRVAYSGSVDPYVYFALIGFVAAAFTEIGDLAESYIKRRVGVKDSGKLLPGHGGLLDRVDGMSFAAPFIWLAATFM